ncbi:uncharacterized protein LOC124657559 [Lolium rigidum]|uniref:uncharacterized protein LOC124657559 n=1 Tax=Lolium rigidum TaxID=89674 RepID=UPI001F5E1506|nr:uncharacterized protein LOC124657559 [Lolium rigidum]
MGDNRRRKARTGAATVAKIDTVADDMLELVFLRLPSPLDLIRAACACKRWRRIIAGDNGRVIRSLHGAQSFHIIGHYRVDGRSYSSRPPGLNPAFFPSKSWSQWNNILPTRNLTLDFLPKPESSNFCWELADIRGGLLLLLLFDEEYYSKPPLRLVICDPRTRRIRSIPLSAWFHGCNFLGTFLLNGEAPGAYISLSNFRVTCALKRNGVARTCAFSSSSGGHWTSSATRGTTMICGNDYWTANGLPMFVGSTEACAYWRVQNGYLALDKEAAQLSLSVLPEALRGKPHIGEYAYKLPWPPMIRACLS